MSKSICACINQSKSKSCTYPAKPGSIYCGVHAKCAKPSAKIQPVKIHNEDRKTKTCACTNKSKEARCTNLAKPGSIYCGVHAKCSKPWLTKIRPEQLHNEDLEGIALPPKIFYTGGIQFISEYLHDHYSIFIENDTENLNKYTLVTKVKKQPLKVVEDFMNEITSGDFNGYIINFILLTFILRQLQHKSPKVMFETLKKIGFTMRDLKNIMKINDYLPFYSLYEEIEKHRYEIEQYEAQSQRRRLDPKWHQRQQKIKSSVNPSDKREELIYICGDTENCLPVENSDLLLKFMNVGKKYQSPIFTEIMFKTLQIMYPKSCFLHPIRMLWADITWLDADIDNALYARRHSELDLTPQNVDKIKDTIYYLLRHHGRTNQSAEYLNFEKYKRDEIDKCLKTRSSENKPLMAIPLGFGHANMLVIDPNRKEVEHIDPHGSKFLSRSDGYNKVNARIEKDVKYLCNKLFPGYTYIDRSDISDFQWQLNSHFSDSIHGGTCAVWSIWYAYLRLSNPKESRVTIIKYARSLIMKNNFTELEHFIIKFMKQLMSMADIQENDDYYIINGRKIPK